MKRKRVHMPTHSNESKEEDPNGTSESCPSYGSQKYWEERYAANNVNDTTQSSDLNGKEGGDGEAGFSWYFNYEELKPLLLPLCIGRTDDNNDDWSDMGETEELFVDAENEDDEGENLEDEECDGDEKEEDHGQDVDERIEGELDGEAEDLVGEDDASGSEDDFDEEAFRLSDAPRNVIEIGCGDVPLGSELCKNLLRIQEKTSVDALKAVSRIVCFDYSETVIDLLIKKQQEEIKDSGGRKKSGLTVEYKVHDARDLPYEDREFHVVIDKGTLDAMLSDKEHGKDNCIKIVSESARILAPDGYILIVSHLNANSSEGLAWTQEVLVPGLKDGDNVNDWRIEVHGNDGEDESNESPNRVAEVTETEENEEDEEKHYGPAVYIIRKVAVSDEERKEREKMQKESRADMKFFGY